MNIRQFLMALSLFSASQVVTAAALPPADAEHSTSPESLINKPQPKEVDPIANVRIGDEEKRYISAECKRFAQDDEVLKDDLSDYLATCNRELTIAVKTAILKQRQKRKRQAEALKASRNTAGRPQPL